MKKTNRKFNELTRDEKESLTIELEESANTLEFLNIIINHFDLANNQPGTITKGMLSRSMINTVLPLLNPVISEKGI